MLEADFPKMEPPLRTRSFLFRTLASLVAGSVLQVLAVEPQIGVGVSSGVTVSAMMIKADGTLWGWGSARAIGDGSPIPPPVRPVPVQIGTDTNWVSLAMSGVFGMGIRADGTLWAWGENQNGVLGNGTFDASPTPIQVGSESNWREVSVPKGGSNGSHVLAIRTDGTLWAWGTNQNFQLGFDTGNPPFPLPALTPTQVGTDSDWLHVFAGSGFSMAIKSDGTRWAWGANNAGQLGSGNTLPLSVPTLVDASPVWQTISTASNFSSSFALGLKTDGTLWGWGQGYGPTPVRLGAPNLFTSVAAANTNYAVRSDGTLFRVFPTFAFAAGPDTNWWKVVAVDSNVVLLKTNGDVLAAGQNQQGAVGNGTLGFIAEPVVLNTSTLGAAGGFRKFLGNFDRDLALGNDGSLVIVRNGPTIRIASPTWSDVAMNASAAPSPMMAGINSAGQLMNLVPVFTGGSPVALSAASDWTRVVAGGQHMLALRADGSLWAWGQNFQGQLGDGNAPVAQAAPVAVGVPNAWTRIAAGSAHSLAIRADGTLWAWGGNGGGQLGDGTTNPSAIPIQIGSSTQWLDVGAGQSHSLGISANGLWAWGINNIGQLGDGTTEMRLAPVKIDSALWSRVTGGTISSHGVKADGTLWSWGGNFAGDLGDGSFRTRLRPVRIGPATDWIDVSTYAFQGLLGVRADGSVWTWADSRGPIFSLLPVDVRSAISVSNFVPTFIGAFRGSARLIHPDLATSPVLDFGPVALGGSKTLPLAHAASGNVIQSVAATGPFSVSHDCPLAPAVATDCTLQVTFTPVAGGSVTGRLTIAGSSDLSHAPLRLSGNGDTSAPPIGSTPTGSAVEVELPVTLPDGSPQLVEVTFGTVGGAGTTSVTVSSSPTAGTPAIPADFKVGEPPLYYDVSTNASFSNGVKLCFGWNEGQFADESTIRLWHLSAGVWEDITTLPVDTASNVVCGVATSLSPFVIAERAFRFAGFYAPVSNTLLNAVRAGSGVPLKFSLGGDYGLGIFASGYPQSYAFNCARWTAGATVEGITTAGGSSLAYDAASGQYNYVWKAEKDWIGTCRTVVMRFTDGTTRSANFDFR
jgi:alpha-tubulin suppressor-like RCC1 family protein